MFPNNPIEGFYRIVPHYRASHGRRLPVWNRSRAGPERLTESRWFATARRAVVRFGASARSEARVPGGVYVIACTPTYRSSQSNIPGSRVCSTSFDFPLTTSLQFVDEGAGNINRSIEVCSGGTVAISVLGSNDKELDADKTDKGERCASLLTDSKEPVSRPSFMKATWGCAAPVTRKTLSVSCVGPWPHCW
jgi:hypothetical protein